MTASGKNIRKETVPEQVALGYFERGDRTLLLLRGADAEDFLQRMSTNDMSALDEEPVQTALTTEKGRIVDVLMVVKLEEKDFLLCGISGDQKGTIAWLEKFIIMDDVSVQPATSEYRHILFVEGGTPLPAPPGSRQFRDKWGQHLILPRASASQYLAGLTMGELNPATLETHRVMHGIPDWPSELSNEYNPLEAGLPGVVSWTKGCYVGQEVIARLDTYKKLQRCLVSLLIEGDFDLHRSLYIGKDMVGTVTSHCLGSDGKLHGLGYVKPAIALAKPIFKVGGSDSGIRAFIKE